MMAHNLQQYPEGTVIYQAGEHSSIAYLLHSGHVELRGGDSGELVRTIAAGEMFGGEDVINNHPHQETAIAASGIELRVLQSEEITELARKSNGHAANGHALNGHAQMRSVKFGDSEAYREQLASLGPLRPLMEDEGITDILINGAGQVYIERRGTLEVTDVHFESEAELLKLAEQIVVTVGRTLDPKRPLVDARLLDGSRVNIIAPPLAVDGVSISIRKFAKKGYTLDSLQQNGSMSPGLADFLKVCAHCRLNIIISGGTGSGKTTLLNALSQHISETERIVTIEDAAELQLCQPHVVRLETKPLSAATSAYEEVTIRDLVKNALRMRPDRILVGEVRGAEAFDMMQAMNTGHEGSLTTVHANHPRDALSRIENMIGMANLNIPPKSVRQQIASAVNLIVQTSRMRDGHRRVTYVSELVGMESDVISMQDLFQYVMKGEDKQGQLVGEFKWTGILPRFLRRISYYGEEERLSKALGIAFPKL